MQSAIDDKDSGITRVCADDVGAAMRSIASLSEYKRVFDCMRVFARLCVAPHKCKVVPLWAPFTRSIATTVAAAIAALIPDWSHFSVVAIAKYLGLMLGPAANDDSWAAPVRKWTERSKIIASSALSPTVSVQLYNARAVPTLMYVAQFMLPPDSIISFANARANSLIHTPPNTVTSKLLAQFGTIGGLSLLHAPFACLGALVRASLCTLSWTIPLADLRRSAAGESIELRRQYPAFDTPWPAHWVSSAICLTLGRLSEGTLDTGSKPLSDALRRAVALVRPLDSMVQKRAYASIVGQMPGKLLRDTLADRLAAHFPDYNMIIRFHVGDQWDSLRRRLTRAHSRISIPVIKSWLGGWCTSHRCHEPLRLPCLFGCPPDPSGAADSFGIPYGTDSWLHYGRCSKMWQLVYHALQVPLPPGFHQRIGLCDSGQTFVPVALAFDVYHSLKLNEESRSSHLHLLQHAPALHELAPRRAFLNELRRTLKPLFQAAARRLAS